MIEAKHTPTPYVVRKFGTGIWVMDAIPDRDGKVVANVIAGPCSNLHWEETAAFIVLACNCHDDLLSSCKSALGNLEHSVDEYPGNRLTVDELKAAIAKAERDQP